MIIQPPHLKQSHGSTGQRRPGPLRPVGRGSDPGRLDQDDHLDDGEAERAHGPQHADRARAAHELGLVEAGKVGEARRHRHPGGGRGTGSGEPERNQRRVRPKQQPLEEQDQNRFQPAAVGSDSSAPQNQNQNQVETVSVQIRAQPEPVLRDSLIIVLLSDWLLN